MKHIRFSIDENLRRLPDQVLLQQTDLLAQECRNSTLLLLRHLCEIEVRRLFIDLGFSSMHKYCIQQLKFSEGEAQRRLASARLLTELPEIEKQIESGNLNVTNLAKIQSFLRVEKSADHPLSKKEKLELIEQMENKSTRQVEQELVQLSHQPALMAEKFHCSLPDSQAVKFEALLDVKQQDLLAEFKNLFAHELADFANGSILTFLLEKAVQHKKKKLGLLKSKELSEIKKTDSKIAKTKNSLSHNTCSANAAPLPSAPKAQKANSWEAMTPVRIPQRKHIRTALKKQIWQRAQACCEYQDPRTRQRCASKFALELDHIRPLALGGRDEIHNLQLLCREHNSRRSIKTFNYYLKIPGRTRQVAGPPLNRQPLALKYVIPPPDFRQFSRPIHRPFHR